MRRATEIWHFYAGDRVEHLMLGTGGEAGRRTILGNDVLAAEVPQLVVPAGAWQGARLAGSGGRGWALLGCTLTPPWDDNDFEPGERSALEREFPGARASIRALTR